jgi:ribosomal protein S18 acetylase RimI-like enzyme
MSFEENSPQIAVASAEDLDAVCSLDALVLGDTSRQGLLAESIKAEHCHIAKENGNLLGLIVFQQKAFYGHGFIPLLVVHPAYRRRRVAEGLIRHIRKICPEGKLFTSTNHSNLPMQNLLEKTGFVRRGYIENLDEDDPEIVYFKKIGDKL